MDGYWANINMFVVGRLAFCHFFNKGINITLGMVSVKDVYSNGYYIHLHTRRFQKIWEDLVLPSLSG
jgi:hypothetical protein